MKKNLALTILVILSLTLFTACSTPSVTEKQFRCSDGEQLTYKISLADFSTTKTTFGGNDYYKDYMYAGEIPLTANDRIVPQSLSGEYKVEVAYSSANVVTITTTESLNSTYTTEQVATLNLSDEDKAVYVVGAEGQNTTLVSTSTTSVTFHKDTQMPAESSTEVKGFYLGKEYQELSNYSLKTTYTTDGNSLTAKVTENGAEKHTSVLDKNAIDAHQILWYVRSFEKTSTSFQNSPSVTVYDATTNVARKMSFFYTYSQKVLVYNGETPVPAQLNRLDVLLDGMSFMTQFNLPNLTDNENREYIDSTPSGSSAIPKYTTYRFRVGFASYELQNYVDDTIAQKIDVSKKV